MKYTIFLRYPCLIKELQKLAKGKDNFRFGSFGCSTGNEAYSAALALEKIGVDYEVVGIDRDGVDPLQFPALYDDLKISSTNFEHIRLIERTAKSLDLDIYEHFDYKNKFLFPKNHIRERVSFLRHDLEDPFQLKPFDAIFCLNVLTDADHPNLILRNIKKNLNGQGYISSSRKRSSLVNFYFKDLERQKWDHNSILTKVISKP